MAETAPLLPQLNHVPRDHLIFLYVCHSPWPFLHQTGLLIVRGTLAVYLTAVLALSVVKDCEGPYARFLAFDARYLSFATQAIYYWMTATWAMQHLLGFPSPADRLPPEEQAKGRYLAMMQKAFSIPVDADIGTRKPIAFSLFYTASVTFPLVVTIASWSFLDPLNSSIGPPFWPRPLVLFNIANFNGVNSAVAFLEIMILSSVQKQKLSILPFPIIAQCLLYFLWVVIGRFATGHYVYDYFDPAQIGWKGLVATYIYILSLSVFMFLIVRGMHGLREKWVRKTERGGQNH